ncbi:MAG: type II toxin-antitoxin system prevent-host-death family antitoxin [Acidobacteria bacterium]|nr:type II toxin-antitoxin system prevent-host-death family antitoxin [Acidobacteriota bacterium]
MIKVSLKEAEAHLGQLIEKVAAGQEVVITGNGGSTVRLVALAQEEENEQSPSNRPAKTVGRALDHFIGTWTAEQEAELLQAVEVFERVDESFWADHC